MTFFKGPAEQRADERRVKDIGPPANPAWWTPVRVEVMRALMRRSEIHVRMASMTPGREKTPRWRPHAVFMKTKHLFEGSSGGILTPQNVGPAIRNLIEWGFLRKAPTAVAQVEFTIKGWAWLAAEGHIEPAWLELIFERQDADRAKAWELCRKIKGSRKLHNLSTQFAGGLQEKVVADIMEPSPMTENMPFVEPPTEDELPGLPQFSPDVEEGIRARANNGDEVIRQRLQLARDFRHQTIGALSKMEPKEIDGAISRHFSSEEIIRADLEMARDQRAGPRDSYYSRELVNRMSEAGEFKPRSLADHLGAAPAKLDGLPRGADRIAFAVEAQELRDAGLARHMPGSTTLGDVHDRLRAESVTEMGQDHETSIPDANTIMDNGKPYRRDEAIADVISHGEDWRTALTFMRDHAAPATEDSDDVGYWQHQLTVLDRILLALDIASEPVSATPENIAKANKEWKAEDDKLPMVDWIDKRLGQYDYDGWVPKGNAALVAREAVFRHMRENPVGARVVMSEDQPFVQYDGFRLHVRQQDYTPFEGRPCQFIMSVDSDYDPQDTENIKAWFGEFISFGAAGMRGELVKRDDSLRRSYHYPAGSNVDHEVVGELEAIKVRSINPLWMVGMMFGSSFLALIMFLVFLNFLPGQS
ncbi:membrane protein [Brevundimonas phage vB_BsubS-Delta]|nr:membrane protein [Brevundimonas phage vB_BsubS-Delta]